MRTRLTQLSAKGTGRRQPCLQAAGPRALGLQPSAAPPLPVQAAGEGREPGNSQWTSPSLFSVCSTEVAPSFATGLEGPGTCQNS